MIYITFVPEADAQNLDLKFREWDGTDTRFVSEGTYVIRSSRAHIEAGDIILSREGTAGIAAIVEQDMRLCMGKRLVQVRASLQQLTL